MKKMAMLPLGATLMLSAGTFTLIPTHAFHGEKSLAQSKPINLTGKWQRVGGVGYTFGSGGCTLGNDGIVTSTVPQIEIQQVGNKLVFPSEVITYTSYERTGSYRMTRSGTISGNQVTIERQGTTDRGGLLRLLSTGTVSSDGNRITGKVVCTYSEGTAKAEQTFVWQRQTQKNAATIAEFKQFGLLNQPLSFPCTPARIGKNVWGTDTYSMDSSICAAAVHAGRLKRDKPGIVTIKLLPAQKHVYQGSSRNLVGSQSRVTGSLNDPQVAFQFVEAVDARQDSELPTDAIQKFRKFIAQRPEQERILMYRFLQGRTKFFNQHNNESRRSDDYGQARPNQMCGVTTLANVLTYLGARNPNPGKQFENALEDLRRNPKLHSKLQLPWTAFRKGLDDNGVVGGSEVWGVLGYFSTYFGAKAGVDDYYELGNLNDDRISKIKAALDQGSGVLLGINMPDSLTTPGPNRRGHIVRIQGYDDTGFIIDDANGNVSTGSYTENTKVEGNDSYDSISQPGNNNKWTYAFTKRHSKHSFIIHEGTVLEN